MQAVPENPSNVRDPAEDEQPSRGPSLFARMARLVSDMVVPPVCTACQQPLAVHDALCASCWRQVSFIRAPLCDRLGLPLPFDTGGRMISAAAAAHPPVYDRARAVARFDGVMRELVHKFKYADRQDARHLFGRWLANAGSDLLAEADVLVPVPLHRTRLWQRRFNQSAVLAFEVSRLSGVPVDLQMLTRARATTNQVGLSQAERKKNVAGAFRLGIGSKVDGRHVLLIDDVITTGSTVTACVSVLRQGGAARVDVLALGLVTGDGQINP